jgi:NHL repeat
MKANRPPNPHPTQARTAAAAVRVGSLALLAAALLSLALASTASADQALSQVGEGAGQTRNPQGLALDFETGQLYVADSGNHRISVFAADGSFEMAFGWGVADGKAELQSCGPKATPPTATCRAGLVSGGAGAFTELQDIAVDNDPGSASHHDVYVVDRQSGLVRRGSRVQKFDPDGNFLLTWGGGVITGGATGTGTLASGSKEVTAVKTTARAFDLGQTITGTGIPANTLIVAVGPGTITLSKAATASGTAVALAVAAGPGNVPVNEVNTLQNDISPFKQPWRPNFIFRTLDPSPAEPEIGETIDPEANAAEMQEKLEALPNIGPGNVKVTGEKINGNVHEYTVELVGALADTDGVFEVGGGAGGRNVLTVQNGGGGAEICTAAIAASCSGGILGDGQGQFSRNLNLAVGPGGIVYLADCGVETGIRETARCDVRLQKFTPGGAFVEELALPQAGAEAPYALAVDSAGDFYLSSVELRKYDPAGNQIAELTGSGSPIAVEGSDNALFAEEKVVAQRDPAGSILRRFGYGVFSQNGFINGIAPAPSGEAAFISEEDQVFRRDFPAPGPIVYPKACRVKEGSLGNTKAILEAEVNPEGKATTVEFEYVDQDSYETEGGFESPNTKTTASTAIGSDFELHVANGLANLVPTTEYRCRAIATNADAPAGVIGEEGSFKSLDPLEILSTSASEIGTATATLNAVVNPLGIPTTGFFEYVEEATYQKDIAELGPEHGFDHALKVPDVDGGEEAISFGAGEKPQLASVELAGLVAGNTYRYRVIATDPYFPAGFAGPTKAFRTFRPGAALPDERAWELVTPSEKNGAEVSVPAVAGGIFQDTSIRIQAGSTDGEAVTYTSFTSFGEAGSAPGSSQYLSRRTAGGWVTENLSPAGRTSATTPPFQGFTPDLRFGGLAVQRPSLTADCPEGFPGLYLRDNQTGALRCLVPEVPKTPGAGCPFVYAGTSADGSRAFFSSVASYAGAPEGSSHGVNLYESTAAEGIRLVSVLPDGQPALPQKDTAFGPSYRTVDNCQSGAQTVRRNVVSADGSKVFWTYVPDEDKEPTRLMVRVDGEKTIQLDAKPAKKAGSGTPGGGVFQAASSDGSLAYFTAESRLISNSKSEPGKPDLYRYQLGAEEPLTNLTRGVLADVQGLVGTSEDGAYVYYVAKGVVSAEPNAAGESAIEGQNNLYLHHEGETRFIATLAPEDYRDWESEPVSHSARVSADGHHLAFLSTRAEQLAGYDNTVAVGTHCEIGDFDGGKYTIKGGPLCPQAFVYDLEADELTCASCNPSGARPLGPTRLPGWSNNWEGPRYLSEDGRRLFFESFDALNPGDENGMRDVYEFERSGKGTCTPQSPEFDAASDGCQSLLSGALSSDETYLIDASADGRDVFFATRAPLVGWDGNENYDIYDARSGGGFPEPNPPAPDCQGEACKAPAGAPPPAVSPATQLFQSAGNPAPDKPKCRKGTVRKGKRCFCPKGKVRKGGRCVRKPGKHHGKNRPDRRAGAKQGVGR